MELTERVWYSLYQTRPVRDYAFEMGSAAYAKQLKARLLNSLYTWAMRFVLI